LQALAATNQHGDGVAFLMIIVAPIFGLYRWRRRQSGVSGASQRAN